MISCPGYSQLRKAVTVSIAFGLAIAACSSPTEPSFPINAVAFNPPKHYSLWWRLTEACAVASGSLERVSWFHVPGVSKFLVDGELYQGMWYPRGNRIVIGENELNSGDLVRHEMLHALVGSRHERRYFVEACDGVVSCVDKCVLEAGHPPAPDSQALAIAVSEIDVDVEVEPSTLSVAADGEWIAISVSARNPMSTGVWARLSTIEGNPAFAASFGYILDCVSPCNGNTGWVYDFIEGSRFGFVGGGTRRRVFDLRASSGTFAVRATFNSDTTPPVTFSVIP